jgi:hypothetical protein
MPRDPYLFQPVPVSQLIERSELFSDVISLWFWFVIAMSARHEGARIKAGAGSDRPCEPTDVLTIVHRLYRHRLLLMDHLRVLNHYGHRQRPPDPRLPFELRAHTLWKEAMEKLDIACRKKGLIQ